MECSYWYVCMQPSIGMSESFVVSHKYYIRPDICNIFILAFQLSSFLLSFVYLDCFCFCFFFTTNHQRLARLYLVGEYVPIFPTGFLAHNF